MLSVTINIFIRYQSYSIKKKNVINHIYRLTKWSTC